MKNLVRLALVLFLLLTTSGAYAQKIDQLLTRLAEKTAQSRALGQKTVDGREVSKTMSVVYDEDGTITRVSAIATLNDGAVCPTEKLEKMGIKVRFVLGDMVALDIPISKLTALEDVEEFCTVKADRKKRVYNNAARDSTGVNKVNTSSGSKAEKLPKAYTGAGVVLGVIDMGIDYQHAAFRDAKGNTRIKMIIEFDKNNNMLKYTSEADILSKTYDTTDGSHGTHTSGTAGGSFIGNDSINGPQGMAPEAELILCGLGDRPYSANIIASIKEIFNYAESVGKPAVVNISLGGCLGLHDGSSEEAKAVVELTENGTKKGRVVVISAGNDAANQQSIYKKLPAEKNYNDCKLMTVLGATKIPTESKPNQKVEYGSNYFFYSDDHEKFQIGAGVVNLKTGKIEQIGTHVRFVKNNKVAKHEELLVYDIVKTIKGTTKKVYEMLLKSDPVYIDDADYRLAIFVDGTTGDLVRMICDGDNNAEPCFDAPTTAGYDLEKAGYEKGWGDFACSAEICSDCVISVGSYITRSSWINDDNMERAYQESSVTGKIQALGEISDFSGYCTTDDNGKPRPLLLAPGQGLISAANNYDEDLFLDGQPGVKNTQKEEIEYLCKNVNMHNRSNWYVVEQGTSMAAPVVSGIIALWMQANPNLSVEDVKAIMKETCRNDQFTTDTSLIPSGKIQQVGLGKIDCLAGLRKILGTPTGIETIGMDQRREATPATMYAVDAPVYNMMGQKVNKSQKGIVIYKGRKYVNK